MIGRRIKMLREDKGISQAELAAAVGVSRMSINNYENGKRMPDIDFVLTVSNYFGVTLEYLTGQTEFRYKDDIKVSLEKTEELFHALEKLPQRESQIMVSNLIQTLEKAAELGISSDTLQLLAAFCSQMTDLLCEYDKLGKEVAPIVTELKSRKMPKEQSLAFLRDRLRSIYSKTFEMMDMLAGKTKSYAKTMITELEKQVERLIGE